MGANQFTKYTRRMAVQCQFNNPERCIAHGKRKVGVLALVSAKDTVDNKIHQKSSHHKSITSNLRYLVANDTAMEKNSLLFSTKVKLEKKRQKIEFSLANEVASNIEKNRLNDIPVINHQISTIIARNSMQQQQILSLQSLAYFISSGQVQHQPTPMLGPQVLQYSHHLQFLQTALMQMYKSAISQPII